MTIRMLRSKLHKATVTCADIDYEGSITIPLDILAEADMYPYEKVLVADINNGERFETYILPGEADSRQIQINGAAARRTSVGDRVIIMAFSDCLYPPPADWEPRVLILDQENRVSQTLGTHHAPGN